MIEFRNVNFTYPDAPKPALCDISFNIDEGQLVLVTGPSGSGKSSLLRCINGLVPHFSGGTLSGYLRVAGIDPVTAPQHELANLVGFVFQDPESQFIVDQVEDEIAFGLENQGIPRKVMQQRVDEALRLTNLTALRSRRIETLSGGEKQRVALASVLALQPRILILDEPTSQLDPDSSEEVLQSLVVLKKHTGMTILIAEHRLERLMAYTDQIIHIEGGCLAAAGDPRKVLAQTKLNPPLVELGKSLGWDPLPLTIQEAEQMSSGQQLPAITSSVPPIHPNGKKPVMIVENLGVKINDQPILQGVNFHLTSGTVSTLMGANGAGKTTLLRCMVGLRKPDQGCVRINGKDTANRSVAEICREIAYLPQDPNAMLFADTVEEELWITLRNHAITTPVIPPIELLSRLGLAEKSQAYPRDLSTGERQRVALGAITVTHPGLILLDEPTRGLDYCAKQGLIDIIHGWKSQGLAVLLVTHDVELAALISDRVIILDKGEIIAQGEPQEILSSIPPFITQIAQVYPDTGCITVSDVLKRLEILPQFT